MYDLATIFKINANTPALGDVAERVLNAKVDKSVRISDWERRPLRPQQLEYAGILSIGN